MFVYVCVQGSGFEMILKPSVSEFFTILYFFSCLRLTGMVVLKTAAPALTRTTDAGVFAVNENVSLLLQFPNHFLPTCYHDVSGETHTLTLSKVNNGPIWAQEALPDFPARLVPWSPPFLQPNLTGTYHCTAPRQVSRNSDYRLDVVGKKKNARKN